MTQIETKERTLDETEPTDLTAEQRCAVAALVEVVGDRSFVTAVVADLRRRTHLDATTAEVVFTEALFGLLKHVESGRELRVGAQAWITRVARNIASKRSEILVREPDGKPHTVTHVALQDFDAAGEPPGDEVSRQEALRRWRELVPLMGWELAEEVWDVVLQGLEDGAVVMDVRTIAEITGKRFAAVKTAYYRGGERLARLALEHGLIDPRRLAESVVVDDDEEEEDDDDD